MKYIFALLAALIAIGYYYLLGDIGVIAFFGFFIGATLWESMNK